MPRSKPRWLMLAAIAATGCSAVGQLALEEPVSAAGAYQVQAAAGQGGDRRPPPEKLFAELDRDGDGGLSAEEVAAGLDRLPPPRPRGEAGAKRPERPSREVAAARFLKRFDEDGDGSVSLAEFKRLPPPPPRESRIDDGPARP